MIHTLRIPEVIAAINTDKLRGFEEGLPNCEKCFGRISFNVYLNCDGHCIKCANEKINCNQK